jgi:ornithine carbamoyltransferase
VVEWVEKEGPKEGMTIRLTHDPIEAASHADVIYTDVWASMGQEAEHEKRVNLFKPYQINEALMAKARKGAIFMHCLPAHRGEEVTDAVADSPQSVIFDQAENRLHVQKAIMLKLMGNM